MAAGGPAFALPTNAALERICCASDGLVYITTNGRNVIVGREDRWAIVEQDVTPKAFEDIVDFNGRVLISTVPGIYDVVGGRFRSANLPNMPPFQSNAHMAAGDGISLIAGRDEGAIFDGENWNVFLEPARD